MHVLLTRPERDAAVLQARIAALGCRVSLAPLLDIQLRPIAADALAGATAIVATSRNGLKALAHSDALQTARALPIFAVGPATAQLAHELGFETVIPGAGTGADLVPIVSAHPSAASGKLVHLAGDHLAFDLAGALRERGIELNVLPVYASVAAETLQAPVVADLAAREIDAVVLMSPRSAAIWARLTAQDRLHPALTGVTHICLSDAVAGALSGIDGLTKVIAEQPNADAIVSAVYRLAGSAKTG